VTEASTRSRLRIVQPPARTPADYLQQHGVDAAPKRRGERVLQPGRPDGAIEKRYRGRLDELIAAMQLSLVHWVKAAYRRVEPRLAQDDSPAMEMRREMARLRRRWQRQFDQAAPALADYFARAAAQRSDAQLRTILRRAGISVRFTLTRDVNNVMQATIGENVALIKSIAEQHLAQVEGSVMRAVQTGRDLGSLAQELEHTFGVTKRRAAFIARDQNNKATAVIQRARYMELGIKEAVWLHSHAGKQPRPTHVAMNGKRFAAAKGMYDSAVRDFVLPGVLPNCRCVSRAVLPGVD
jgi:SPP1 gp7 family putative phage head morphogenesis protein